MFVSCYECPALNYNIETANEDLWSDILALRYETKITLELRMV